MSMVDVQWVGGLRKRPIVAGVFVHRRLGLNRVIDFLVATGADRTVIVPDHQCALGITDAQLEPAGKVTVMGAERRDFQQLSNCTLVFFSKNGEPLIYNDLTPLFYSVKATAALTQGCFYSVLGQDVLGDDFARTFFGAAAVVDVYLTERLTTDEIAVFYFHLGELRRSSTASRVHFIGEHVEGNGSVLRFQADTFEQVYNALPALLAPFQMLRAIDVERTSRGTCTRQRQNVIGTLMKFEVRTARGRWRVAERIAQVFEGYRNARIYRIREGGKHGLRMDIFTDDQIARELSAIGLADVWDRTQPLNIVRAGTTTIIQAKEVAHMGHNVNIGGDSIASPVGDGLTIHARDIASFRTSVEQSATLDAEAKETLVEARNAIDHLSLSLGDKNDIIDDLGKLAGEIAKPKPDSARVRRLLTHIKEMTPTVAAILSSIASIAKLIGS